MLKSWAQKKGREICKSWRLKAFLSRWKKGNKLKLSGFMFLGWSDLKRLDIEFETVRTLMSRAVRQSLTATIEIQFISQLRGIPHLTGNQLKSSCWVTNLFTLKCVEYMQNSAQCSYQNCLPKPNFECLTASSINFTTYTTKKFSQEPESESESSETFLFFCGEIISSVP